MKVIYECDVYRTCSLSNLTNIDSLLTSSVIGVPNFPEQRFKLVNRLKRRQGAFKIWRAKRKVHVNNIQCIYSTSGIIYCIYYSWLSFKITTMSSHSFAVSLHIGLIVFLFSKMLDIMQLDISASAIFFVIYVSTLDTSNWTVSKTKRAKWRHHFGPLRNCEWHFFISTFISVFLSRTINKENNQHIYWQYKKWLLVPVQIKKFKTTLAYAM